MKVFLRATLGAVFVSLALAGCQISNEEEAGPTFGQTARAVLAKQFGQAPEIPDARKIITAELLAQSPDPILLIVQKKQDTAGVLVPVSTGADGTVQWRDAGGAGLLMRDGVLVGTRGIGFDLLTVDARGLRAALGQGGGQDIARTERRLRGDSTVETLDFLCDVVPTGRETLSLYGRGYVTSRYEERCSGDVDFVNRYWVGGGIIRKSEVFVSPEAGVLELTVLKN